VWFLLHSVLLTKQGSDNTKGCTQNVGRRWSRTTGTGDLQHNGECPKDITDFTMIALKKKPEATICSDHRTVSLMTHAAKRVGRIL
jgi:hypothetical protein